MPLFIRRVVAALAAVLLTVTGLTVTAGSASAADPVTSSRTFPNGTITAAFSDTTFRAGDPFTVTVTVTNTGTTTQGVGYSFRGNDFGTPALFTLDSCDLPSSPSGSCDNPAPDLRVRFSSLPAGQSATATFHARVVPDAAPGSYNAFQTGTIGLVTSMTFSPAVTFTVQPPADADLGVTLTATAGPLLSSQINYAATVTNNGPGTAGASTTTVLLPTQTTSVTGLPAGCTYTTGTRTVTCDTGALANGASTTRSFTANFGLLSLGTLSATAARASSTPTDPNPANDTATRNCTVLTSLIITCP
ncbi:hypothetical protein [Streptomyces sp. NPDC008125]|uniref:hypothetical protein n=1 Tax=Streptomyces sp. NPDC008125 TaxID=3364811 RepID=UPI0036E1D43F